MFRLQASISALLAAAAAALPLQAQTMPQPADQADPAPSQPAPSQGPSVGISCITRDGVPTTMSQTRRGLVPIIKWTSNTFDAAGWTADKRCQVVSQRFETFRVNGQLQYLTSGRVAGQPVICAVPSENAPCYADNVLYTLKAGQDPAVTLNRLLNVRRGASGPISETGRRVYVNFNSFIEQQINEGKATNTTKAPKSRPAPAPLGESAW